MKRSVLFFIILLHFACKDKQVSEENLSYLSGYWEISEVIFPDGSKKDYSFNPTIDFIQFENNQGYRKKMQPKFNGSYNTSNNVESFKVVEANDTFILSYKSNLSAWEEKLVRLDSMAFSVQNEEGILYSYKRFQPITIPQ